MKESQRYWSSYYSVSKPEEQLEPSQFALFTLEKLVSEESLVIDVGCGDGRDSVLFSNHGYLTLGIDRSREAIEVCLKKSNSFAKFGCFSIEDHSLYDFVQSFRFKAKNLEVVIYARFFLHAVNAESEKYFVKFCDHVIEGSGRVFLEFRTLKDSQRPKLAPDHYRRFLDPDQVICSFKEIGFECVFFIEGLGYAVKGNEDPHVARLIFSR